MAFELAPFLALALALGFKHSYDADHIVAVSNILSRNQDLRRAALVSTTWALGHMVTASIVTIGLFVAGGALLGGLLEHFEIGVAFMLIVIGVVALLWEYGYHRRIASFFRRLGGVHEHPHDHGIREHRHPHVHLGARKDHGMMLGIGIVHGLASNDELLILLVAALGVATIPGLLLGVGVFTIGVVSGMIVFAVGLTYPLLRWGDEKVRRTVNVVAALLSLAYGALLLLGLGGFNLLPFGG